MSDRPMRLKYETKMKIILCIFLLNITAVSVFGQSVELHGILGKSIEFPAAVEKVGSLMYGTLHIGDVTSGSFTALRNEKFSSRLQWDSSTGFFSLSGLREEDSGEYKVQNTDQNIITVFQLKMHEDNVPVSKPHVSVTGDEYPCTLLCAVERGTGATLSWYREGEKKPYVSSRVESAPHLHLSAPVERSGTYTCEAKNSVSNETSDPLTVGAHCTAVFGQSVELNGIVGQSVKFPAAVKKGGFLMYSGVTIRDSSRGASRNENYRGRLDWDSSTGFFSLSGLKMEDSGEYKVHNTDQNIAVFQLNVYKDNVNVSKPHVSITHNEHPCTIECTAERGTEATLSWYREGEKKSFASSRVASAPHLHLPHSVESGTYTCEAKNSVSNEMASITVGDHCTDSSTIVAIIIAAAVVVLLIVTLIPVLIYFLRRHKEKQSSSEDAVRTLIQVKKLLHDVDLHAYDETVPPDAVRAFILVKKLLDNVDLHAYDETVHPDAVRTFIQVKKILHNVDPHECDETVPRDDVRTFIQVKELLDNVDLHASGVRSLSQVKKLLDNVDPQAYGETRVELSSDAARSLIQGETRVELSSDAPYLFDHENSEASVKELLDDVDPSEYELLDDVDPSEYELLDDVDPSEYGETSLDLSPDDIIRRRQDIIRRRQDIIRRRQAFEGLYKGMFICHPEATEKITSSHETEVL